MRSPCLHITVSFIFLVNSLGSLPLAQAQDFSLPAPGVMVHLSPASNPPILKGIKVHPDNPFRFDFILDRGDSRLSNVQLKDESYKLIKYFLASLTIPEKDLWVNLSPYEKNRIIPNSFGLTEMGRDLLAEDYMLKQITASLIYPEDEMGRKFWKRVYEVAEKRYGTTNIPVNTFNKVWIVPAKAVVYENSKAGTAYVVESKLKVMLEQDYLSLAKHSVAKDLKEISFIRDSSAKSQNDVSALGSQIIREIVIPELNKEVNEDKNFIKLRQVYNSLILATWYKNKIKDSILAQVYADKNKVAGVNIYDPQEKERIYQRYLQAFKKGVFNYIKEEIIPNVPKKEQESFPRKYFSGGAFLALISKGEHGEATNLGVTPNFEVNSNESLANQAMISSDKAMLIRENTEIASNNADGNSAVYDLPDLYFGSIEDDIHPLFADLNEPLYSTVAQSSFGPEDKDAKDRLMGRKVLSAENDEVYLTYPVKKPKEIKGVALEGIWNSLRQSLIDRVFLRVVERKYGLSEDALGKIDKGNKDGNERAYEIATVFRNKLREFKSQAGITKHMRMGFVISGLVGEQALDRYKNIFIPRDLGYGYSSASSLDRLFGLPRPPPGVFYISRKSLGENYFIDVKEMILRSTIQGAVAYFLLDGYKRVIDGMDWPMEQRERIKSQIDSLGFARDITNTITFFLEDSKKDDQSKPNKNKDDYAKLFKFIQSEDFLTKLKKMSKGGKTFPDEEIDAIFERVRQINRLILRKNILSWYSARKAIYTRLNEINSPFGFAINQFKENSLKPEDLILALEKDGIIVPKAYSPLARLNRLLLSKELYKMMKGRSPEIDFLMEQQGDAVDPIRINRLLIEENYAAETPKRPNIVTMLKDDIEIKMKEDPDFNERIEEITQYLRNLGYDQEARIRFIDSGQGTFPLFLQAIFAIKFPLVQTQGLALAARNKDLLEVYDKGKWRDGLVDLANERIGEKNLRDFLEKPAATIESRDFVTHHPVKWEDDVGARGDLVKENSEIEQLESDWTIINYAVGARMYYQLLQELMSRKGISIEEAARDIHKKYFPDGYFDPNDPRNYFDPTDSSDSNNTIKKDDSENGKHAKKNRTLRKLIGFVIPKNILKSVLVAILLGLSLSPTTNMTNDTIPNHLSTGIVPPRRIIITNSSLGKFIIEGGDTLSQISDDVYGDGRSPQYMKVFDNNKGILRSPDEIYPGNILRFPDAKFGEYIVQDGDTLEKIAKRFYGHEEYAHRIADFNRIKGVSSIEPGKRITIPMSLQEWNLLNQHHDSLDHAMLMFKSPENGGIDLTASKMNIQQNLGGGIRFTFNPTQLAQFQNTPGFVPVIISIEPMLNVKVFLGLR